MRGIAYMIAAAFCLSTIGVLVKLIAPFVPAMTINFYRVFFGFLFLVAVVPFFDKKSFKASRKEVFEYFIVGLLLAVALSFYTTANIYAPVQNVVLINYTYPFFVLILAYFFLGEKITSTKIITLLLAILGLVIINPFQRGEHDYGNMLALIGALFYALLVIAMRAEDKQHDIGDAVWFFGFASLLLLPTPFIYGWGDFSKIGVYILFLGVVSTGLAYFLFNLALETIEAEIASIIATIITPLSSIMLAYIIIKESLDSQILLGGAILMIAGIYLQTHSREIKKVSLKQGKKEQ